MQDNFSFNKLQSASSLFMKSDHDGSKDAYTRKMPLGIKTTSQGIEKFSDWRGLSDVLEQKNLANFEDTSVNKIKFSQDDVLAKETNVPVGLSTLKRIQPFGSTSVGFEDEWTANKIKVYDDMAFVAYDEYTDLHRVDIELDDSELRQYLLTQFVGVDYDQVVVRTDIVGTLALETDNLSYYDNVFGFGDNISSIPSSIDFASYQNCIIKVEFSGTVNRGSVTASGVPKVGYFVYGGALKNDIEDYNTPLNTSSIQYDNNDTDFISNGLSSLFTDDATFKESSIMGKFYLVMDSAYNGLYWNSSSANQNKIDSNTGNIGIQLSIQSNYGNTPGSPDNLNATFPYAKFGPVGSNSLYYQTLDTDKITLIKVQPVRKCGKVDIYSKKRSIVSSIVGNVVTSNGHNLKTNDIVEFSNVLFDGSQNGVADIHPLNGTKYVKIVDDDTFEIYDDEFFKDQSSTNNIRTTDGVTWKCISNSFGTIGQSWDYHGTLFSPTGRNGYKFVDTSEDTSDKLASNSEFFTTKRLIPVDDSSSSSENDSSITLKFDSDYSDLVNGDFGESIDKKIPKTFGTHSSVFDTPLNDPKRAYWDFYPFNCQDDKSVLEDSKSSYWGSRFGCDLDIKFSHKSGNSRIYTLAVGERGSDYSVDVFGVDKKETHYNVPYCMNLSGDWVDTIFRRRIVPWSLPHGKTHLLKITVDQYNRISDISHVNTVFGGGESIVDDSNYDFAREINPWSFTNKLDWRNGYKNNCLTPKYNSPARDFRFEESQDSILNSYNSHYWARSAAVHWIGHSIPDYKVKNLSERNSKYLRRISADRKTISVQPDGLNNRSRFGSVVFGGLFPPYQRIDRFESNGQSGQVDYGSTYANLFPWVDSFGKSVALKNETGLTSVSGYSDSDPKTVLLSSSTARSNIEYNARNNYLALVDSTYLEEQDTISEIGQIQANFIYSDGSTYTNIDHIYLNSGGGDCDRLFTNLTVKNSQRGLKTGSQAGFGMAEVITSCSLSALHIEWYDNKIIWTDQELYSNKATVNILNFDDAFELDSSFGSSFIDSRPSSPLAVPAARNTGDGFGIDFRYEEGMFVTNSRSKTTEIGFNISDYLNDRDRLDYIIIYEDLYGGFKETQKISATLDKTDEDKYSLHLLTSNDKLLDLPGSVTYENDTINSLTWDIDFDGRYDLFNKKILIKDPLEYSLFSRDYSVSQQQIGDSVSEEQAQLYMAINEKTKISSARSSNVLTYEYISSDQDEYECRDIGGEPSEDFFSIVPFFFFNLPIVDLDTINGVEINFDISSEDIFSIFDIKGNTNLADETNNIIPRLVVYSRDPRSTIIQNGPATNGSSPSFPKYDGGIWSQVDQISAGNEYYSHDFPGWYRGGAQDMFFYGRIPGGSVKTGSVSLPSNPSSYLYGGEKNLGEYYDITAGSRLSGNAGDPAWVSPDVFGSLSDSEIASIVPYAKIFLPAAGPDGYTVNLSRNDLKDFIIKGNLLKDTDRPTNVVSGFSDTSNAYETSNINNTLVFGLVLTNIESFDINTSSITYEEPSSQFDIGAIRYILQSDNDNFDYINARYPYSNVVNFYEPSFEGNRYDGSYLEYDLKATVKSLSAIVSKIENSPSRYSNKFHKIAVFAYDEEPRDEVRENYKTKGTATEKDINIFRSFGSNKFVPVANTSNLNPVISIGRKSNSFSFKGDHEILTTESISLNDTVYHIDKESGDVKYNETPTGDFIGRSRFNQYSLLGGFDLDQDEYLKLNINASTLHDEGIRLYQDCYGPGSGVAPFYNLGIGGKTKDIPLWIGVKTDHNDMNMFALPPFYSPMSLFIHEIQPSGQITTFVRGPDAASGIPLIMDVPTTGSIPLNIVGPRNVNDNISLIMAAQASGDITAYVKGLGKKGGDTSLVTNAVYPASNSMNLNFSPGHSGNIPLFLARNLQSSGQIPLVMSSPFGVSSGVAPLFVSKNTHDKDSELFIKSQRYDNDNQDLYIRSQDVYNSDVDMAIIGPTSVSSSTDTYIKSIFPSGDIDLVIKPIGLPTGVIPLHMASIQKTMPLHINQLLNPFAPMFITGEAIGHNKSASVFLKAQYEVSDANLVMIDPIGVKNNNINLKVGGSEELSTVNYAPMFIGKEIRSNNETSLFVYNDKYSASLGSVSSASDLNVYIFGGLNANDYNDSPLFIQVSPFGSGIREAPLYLKVNEPVFSDNGNIITSGDLTTVISGNNDSNVWIGYLKNNAASLTMTSTYLGSGNAPLYIHRPSEKGIPLNISSYYDTGSINVYITGANIGSGSMDLYISPPTGSGIDMFTRGYLE